MILTTRPCFNKTKMLHKGSEVEIVREYESEGHTCIVFKHTESGEEFRSTKDGGMLAYLNETK